MLNFTIIAYLLLVSILLYFFHTYRTIILIYNVELLNFQRAVYTNNTFLVK